MEALTFVEVDLHNERFCVFMDMWLNYFRETGDKRENEKIINHAEKIIEIRNNFEKDADRIYKIELCLMNTTIIGFCFYCVCKISEQKDTEFGLIIKPLVNHSDYGYIMEYYIKPEYRLNGYGKMMYTHIRNTFEKKEIRTIMLTPSKEAELFWRRMGFYDSGKMDITNNMAIYLAEI